MENEGSKELVSSSAKFVTFEPKGFRDIYWCPFLNEPVINEYRNSSEREMWCVNCSCLLEPETHQFICNILKP